MSKKEYEFAPVYKCRKCQEIVGSMGKPSALQEKNMATL